jgi:hypothetical protein
VGHSLGRVAHVLLIVSDNISIYLLGRFAREGWSSFLRSWSARSVLRPRIVRWLWRSPFVRFVRFVPNSRRVARDLCCLPSLPSPPLVLPSRARSGRFASSRRPARSCRLASFTRHLFDVIRLHLCVFHLDLLPHAWPIATLLALSLCPET